MDSDFSTLTSLLKKSEAGFESKIVGSSMEPAIPDGARIRIRPLKPVQYEEGQIVACAVNGSLFAHRIVFCGRGPRAEAFIITRGDGWTLCDPPTRRSQILGVVIEYLQGEGWKAPGDAAPASGWRRAVAPASLLLIRGLLAIHHELARRVAGICLKLGVLCKRLARGPAPAGP